MCFVLQCNAYSSRSSWPRQPTPIDNSDNSIEPRTIIRAINDSLATILKANYADLTDELSPTAEELTFNTQAELDTYIEKLEIEMRESAKKNEFERAATLRDQIKELRTKEYLFS